MPVHLLSLHYSQKACAEQRANEALELGTYSKREAPHRLKGAPR
jgi:hypothetical protein